MKTQEKQLIPKGWREVKLGDVCDVMIGGTPARKKKEYWDNKKQTNNIWVSIADLSKSRGSYISDSKEYVSDEGVKKSNVKLIPEGTVIMSFKLSVGKMAIAGRNLYTNEAIAGFFPKEENTLNREFLYFSLPGLNYEVDTAIKGKTLNKSKILDVKINLPPFAQQQKIASILMSVNKQIEKTDEIIDKTEELKNGLMQGLFSKGISHTKFKKTELGEMPKEWEIVKLGGVTDFIDYRGKTPKKTKSGIPLITAKNVRKGYLNKEPREYIAVSDYDSWMTRGIPRKGDVLFTTEAPLGFVAQIGTSDKIALAQRIITMQSESFDHVFLKYLLSSRDVQNRIHALGTGGTVRGIKAKVLKEIKLSLPLIEEQKRIASILSSVDEKIEVNKRIKKRITQLKKGLMEDLLSGRKLV